MAEPFWNEENGEGWFYDCVLGDSLQSTGIQSIAGVFPLFSGMASAEQAKKMVRTIERAFLKPGGMVTSAQAHESGQQWDYPNGWAPLQWVTVAGLVNYGYDDLAGEIARRFVETAEGVFKRTGKMMEKYNVCDLSIEGGGGEYPNQDGFGWANAIVKGFLEFLNGNVFWK